MPFLSIIVPVYKVEKYIHQCVDSILNQTLKDFELILIDDGSPDNCPDICDEYGIKDSRVKVIHKENGGPMSACKAGVKIAQGQYIGFVDSDDWIDLNMFEQLGLKALEHNVDMVCCGLIKEFEDNSRPSEREVIRPREGFYNRKMIEHELFPKLINCGRIMGRYVSTDRYDKIFKKDLLKNNLVFCDERVIIGDDMIMVFSCICDAESLYIDNYFFPYHYRIRNGSIMGSYNRQYFTQCKFLNEQLSLIANKKNVYSFETQLVNELVSLAFDAIDLEILNCPDNRKEVIVHIRDICEDFSFRTALNICNMPSSRNKVAIYKFFILLRFYNGLYWLRTIKSKKKWQISSSMNRHVK